MLIGFTVPSLLIYSVLQSFGGGFGGGAGGGFGGGGGGGGPRTVSGIVLFSGRLKHCLWQLTFFIS